MPPFRSLPATLGALLLLATSLQAPQVLAKLNCGGPAEEGVGFEFNFTSRLTKIEMPAVFAFYDHGPLNTSATVLECVFNSTCLQSGCTIGEYNGTFVGNITQQQDGSLDLNVKIDKVVRPDMETRWEWRHFGFEEEFCYLNVYSFTRDITCDQAPYIYYKPPNGTSNIPTPMVRATCTVPHVYPAPTCSFMADDGSKGTLIDEVIYPYDLPEYFTKTCTAEWDITQMAPGTHNFTFRALPDLEGIGQLTKTNKTSSIDLDISNINCTGPRLSPNGAGIEIVCEIESPYPEVNCTFYEERSVGTSTTSKHEMGQNGVGRVENSSPVCASRGYSSDGRTLAVGNCITKCTMTRLFANNMASSATYTYEVKISPELHESVNTAFLTPKTVDGLSIALEPHQAMLGNCPSQVLDPSRRYTCQCIARQEGFPKGIPQWEMGTPPFKVLAEGDDVIGDAILEVDVTMNQQSFRCAGYSPTGLGQVVYYTPRFAKLDSASIPTTLTPFHLCDSDPNAKMTLTCDVSHSQTQTTPTAVVTGIPGGPFNPKTTITNQAKDATEFVFEFRPTEGGVHTGRCVASDGLYPTIKVSEEFTLQVYTPPTASPVISTFLGGVLGGSTITVLEGDHVGVRTHINGGFPEVSATTLTCVGLQNQTSDVLATRELLATKALHGATCTSGAEHLTDCYTMTSDISFNVQYPVSINEFTAGGSNTGPVEIDKGSSVAISCKAEGNPRPQIKVVGQGSGVQLTPTTTAGEGDFGKVFRTTRRLDKCSDSDVFVCKAKNDVSGWVETRLQVIVKCESALKDPTQAERTIKAKEGTSTSIRYGVSGYPAANSPQLNKVVDSKKQPVPNTKYQVTVTKAGTDPSAWNLELTVHDLKRGYSGDYEMSLENGVGASTTLKISLTVEYDESSAVSSEARDGVIGGSVSFLVILVSALIIGYVIWSRRQKHKGKGPKQDNKGPKQEDSGDLPSFKNSRRNTMTYQHAII